MPVIELLQAVPSLQIVIAFLLGLMVGSFLNVVIHRLPIMMERQWRQQCAELAAADLSPVGELIAQRATRATYNLVVPRSACPHCGTPIPGWHNIPVLSYLLLRGRCAACATHISLRYPLVELLTAALSAAVGWKFGLSWEVLAALFFTWSLIALAAIDLDHQLLPDDITLPLLWLGLLISLFLPGTVSQSFPVDPASSIIGAVSGYLSLWIVFQAFKLLTGKEGMGYGDFKLFAAFGAWFGWQMLLLIILIAALTGALVGIALIALRRHGRGVPIPFGPFLAAAGWIALMWGPELIDRYFKLSGLHGPA
jgi:leader peptidase (prepilin peptidase)/N-methyltransferase